MNISEELDRILTEGDPLTAGQRERNGARRSVIWEEIVERSNDRTSSQKRSRRIVAIGALTAAGAAIAISASLLAGTTTPSAAAGLLLSAAHLDASSAGLPSLGAGDYYYQKTAVTQECAFSGPSSSSETVPQMIKYITTGTRETWVDADGQGKVVMIPNPTGVGGSRFATPQDKATWVAEGKPFNACDTVNSGPPTAPGSVSGYSGFGYFFNTSSSQVISAGANVVNLPSNVSTLSQMLSSGEINSDGSISPVPQTCPISITTPFSNPNTPPVTLPSSGSAGCSPSQEVTLVVELLQLPDASAKFGSVAYQVLAAIPGATLGGTVETQDGQSGSLVSVPEPGYVVDVVLNPVTGSLLQSSIVSSPASFTALSVPVDDVASYGPIAVVNGLGSVPS
jgi:hypothetical protein